MFAEGTYKNPVITSVIRLEVDDPAETIAYIKEVFSDGEWNGYYNEHEAWEAISLDVDKRQDLDYAPEKQHCRNG